MNRATPAFALLMAISLALATQAQESPMPSDPAAMQKMWEDFAKVGPEHETLKAYVGKWKTVTKDFMQDPHNPAVSEGQAEFKLVLEGRFLIQHMHGSHQGQPFEGMGITGFDNAKKKYVGSWVDNMGTGVMATEGTYDAVTKKTTETSEMSSPMGPLKIKMVTEHKSDREFLFTMYMLAPDGSELKSMEITYTRL